MLTIGWARDRFSNSPLLGNLLCLAYGESDRRRALFPHQLLARKQGVLQAWAYSHVWHNAEARGF